MAAIGSLSTTTPTGQLCAARCDIRVAGFQAITQQAVDGRSQSCSVSEMGARAAMNREGLHGKYQYSVWGRGNTRISGHSQSSGSQSRGWWGTFLQGLPINRPSANASNNFGENVRVDTRARDPEWLENEEPADEEKKVSVVEVTKDSPNANVAEKAVDRSSNLANSALDKVGDVLRTTGLEVNLDVGLKELTIKELVLKDLGLVLEVRTKPQPPTPPQPEKEEGKNSA